MEKTERELLMQALTAATDVVKLINQSIGLADAHQTAAEFRRLQFKIIPGGKESEKTCGIQKHFTKIYLSAAKSSPTGGDGPATGSKSGARSPARKSPRPGRRGK